MTTAPRRRASARVHVPMYLIMKDNFFSIEVFLFSEFQTLKNQFIPILQFTSYELQVAVIQIASCSFTNCKLQFYKLQVAVLQIASCSYTN
jgi:hypothetical protein